MTWYTRLSRSPRRRRLWIFILTVLMARYLADQFKTTDDQLPYPGIMDVEFNPERCAELHNKLLAKTYESVPDAAQHFERNMIARVRAEIPNAVPWLLEVADEYAETFAPEDLPFYRFFSKINTYSPPGRYLGDVPLSGEFRQPDPKWFYHSLLEDHDDERDIILLYADNVLLEAMDGGLFLDLDTWMVTWKRLDYAFGLPTDLEAWVPLELALRKGLEMWDRDKYYWDGDPANSNSRPLLRSWATRDLNEAVQTWDTLLEAIHSRLPEKTSPAYHDPLPSDLVDEFQISPFAKAFLKAAKRPSFTYVAPGLTTFTNEAFASLMRSETPDAPRRHHISKANLEPDAWPSLVIPATPNTGPVPKDPPGDRGFDKSWGYARWVIARSAGVYTGLSHEDGDTTLMVTVEGGAHEQPVRFAHQRPWGHFRTLTFAEMFDLWTHYVTAGLWEIGVDGVLTPHSWFTDPGTEDDRRVYWSEDCR